MTDIKIPEGLQDAERTLYLVRGPFKLVHNGHKSIGLWFDQDEDGYRVYDGVNGLTIDKSYKVAVTGNSVAFYSSERKSRIVLSPLTQTDVSWLSPDEDGVEIDDLKEIILNEYHSEPGNNLS